MRTRSRWASLALTLVAEPAVAEPPVKTTPAKVAPIDADEDILRDIAPSKPSGKAVNEAIAAFARQVSNDHMLATRVYNYLVKRGIVKALKPKGTQRQTGLWPTSGGKYITEAVYTSEKAAVEALSNVLRNAWDDDIAKKLHELGLKWQYQEPVTKAGPGRRQTITREPGRQVEVTDVKDLAKQLVRSLQDTDQLLRSVRVSPDNIAQLTEAVKNERRFAIVNKKRLLVDRADAVLNKLRERYPEMRA